MPHRVRTFLAIFLSFIFFFEQSGFAQVAGELDISSHFLKLSHSFIQDKFRPLHLRYLSYDTLNNNFKLLLDKGDSDRDGSLREGSRREPSLSPGHFPSELKQSPAKESVPPIKGTVPEEKLKNATKTLLNYFFIGITLPNSTFWVNLRPDSPDNVIDAELAKTDIGKILLEQDLQLKKDTAKATSPETPEGKEYWNKLYQKAEELFGSSNITIPTLTRPWIVPDEIIIRETPENAYVYKATLKVMLEEDYLSSQPSAISSQLSAYSFKDPRLKELNAYSTQLLKETIIPKLTKEVNTAKRYAPLRQVYYSLILAQWFKQRFYGKGGLYSWLIDQKNLKGLTSKEPWSKTTYFKEYQRSFKEGEYNLKEPAYTSFGQSIRSYMSGGMNLVLEIPSVPPAQGQKAGGGSSPVTTIGANPARNAPKGAAVVGVEVAAGDGVDNLLGAISVGKIAEDKPSGSSPVAEMDRREFITTTAKIVTMAMLTPPWLRSIAHAGDGKTADATSDEVIKLINRINASRQTTGEFLNSLLSENGLGRYITDKTWSLFVSYLDTSNWLDAAKLLNERREYFRNIIKGQALIGAVEDILNRLSEAEGGRPANSERWLESGRYPASDNMSEKEHVAARNFAGLDNANNINGRPAKTTTGKTIRAFDEHNWALYHIALTLLRSFLSSSITSGARQLLVNMDAHPDLLAGILSAQSLEELINYLKSGNPEDPQGKARLAQIAREAGIEGFILPLIYALYMAKGVVTDLVWVVPEEARFAYPYGSFELWLGRDKTSGKLHMFSPQLPNILSDTFSDRAEQSAWDEQSGYFRDILKLKIHIISPTDTARMKKIAGSADKLISTLDMDFLGTNEPYKSRRKSLPHFSPNKDRLEVLLRAIKDFNEKAEAIYIALSSSFTDFPEAIVKERNKEKTILARVLEILSVDPSRSPAWVRQELKRVQDEKAVRDSASSPVVSPWHTQLSRIASITTGLILFQHVAQAGERILGWRNGEPITVTVPAAQPGWIESVVQLAQSPSFFVTLFFIAAAGLATLGVSVVRRITASRPILPIVKQVTAILGTKPFAEGHEGVIFRSPDRKQAIKIYTISGVTKNHLLQLVWLRDRLAKDSRLAKLGVTVVQMEVREVGTGTGIWGIWMPLLKGESLKERISPWWFPADEAARLKRVAWQATEIISEITFELTGRKRSLAHWIGTLSPQREVVMGPALRDFLQRREKGRVSYIAIDPMMMEGLMAVEPEAFARAGFNAPSLSDSRLATPPSASSPLASSPVASRKSIVKNALAGLALLLSTVGPMGIITSIADTGRTMGGVSTMVGKENVKPARLTDSEYAVLNRLNTLSRLREGGIIQLPTDNINEINFQLEETVQQIRQLEAQNISPMRSREEREEYYKLKLLEQREKYLRLEQTRQEQRSRDNPIQADLEFVRDMADNMRRFSREWEFAEDKIGMQINDWLLALGQKALEILEPYGDAETPEGLKARDLFNEIMKEVNAARNSSLSEESILKVAFELYSGLISEGNINKARIVDEYVQKAGFLSFSEAVVQSGPAPQSQKPAVWPEGVPSGIDQLLAFREKLLRGVIDGGIRKAIAEFFFRHQLEITGLDDITSEALRDWMATLYIYQGRYGQYPFDPIQFVETFVKQYPNSLVSLEEDTGRLKVYVTPGQIRAGAEYWSKKTKPSILPIKPIKSPAASSPLGPQDRRDFLKLAAGGVVAVATDGILLNKAKPAEAGVSGVRPSDTRQIELAQEALIPAKESSFNKAMEVGRDFFRKIQGAIEAWDGSLSKLNAVFEDTPLRFKREGGLFVFQVSSYRNTPEAWKHRFGDDGVAGRFLHRSLWQALRDVENTSTVDKTDLGQYIKALAEQFDKVLQHSVPAKQIAIFRRQFLQATSHRQRLIFVGTDVFPYLIQLVQDGDQAAIKAILDVVREGLGGEFADELGKLVPALNIDETEGFFALPYLHVFRKRFMYSRAVRLERLINAFSKRWLHGENLHLVIHNFIKFPLLDTVQPAVFPFQIERSYRDMVQGEPVDVLDAQNLPGNREILLYHPAQLVHGETTASLAFVTGRMILMNVGALLKDHSAIYAFLDGKAPLKLPYSQHKVTKGLMEATKTVFKSLPPNEGWLILYHSGFIHELLHIAQGITGVYYWLKPEERELAAMLAEWIKAPSEEMSRWTYAWRFNNYQPHETQWDPFARQRSPHDGGFDIFADWLRKNIPIHPNASLEEVSDYVVLTLKGDFRDLARQFYRERFGRDIDEDLDRLGIRKPLEEHLQAIQAILQHGQPAVMTAAVSLPVVSPSASSPATQKGDDLGKCVTGDTLLPILPSAISHQPEGNGLASSSQSHQPSAKEYILKPIVQVKPGDYVLSLNEETQAVEPHRIKGLLDMGVKPVFKLTTASGRSIKTTANHPYLTNKGWVKVSGLRVGDEIGVPKEINARVLSGEGIQEELPNNIQKDFLNLFNGYNGERPQFLPNKYFIDSNNFTYFYNGRFGESRGKNFFFAKEQVPCVDSIGDFRSNSHYDNIIMGRVELRGRNDYCWPLFKSRKICKGKGDKNNLALFKGYHKYYPQDYSRSQNFLQRILREGDHRRGFLGAETNLGADAFVLQFLVEKFPFLSFLTYPYSLSLPPNHNKYNTLILSLSRLFLAEAEAAPAIDSAILWDRIISIEPLPPAQVYDIEVEGTHNFIGNGIFAHNTYLPSDQRTVTSDQIEGGASSPMGDESKENSLVARLDRIKAEKWVEESEDPVVRSARRKLVDNITEVTLAEFNEELKITVDKLNQVLLSDETPYAVLWDYDSHKSRRWAYFQAEGYLIRKPAVATYFQGNSESRTGALRRVADRGIQRFVIIDDAAYSGGQIARSIKEVRKLYHEWGLPEPEFIVAIPFVTEDALQLIKKDGERINILFSKKMITVSDILSEAEQGAFARNQLELERQGIIKRSRPYGEGKNGIDIYVTLTFFHHKIADAFSFLEDTRILLQWSGYPGPYNDPQSDYYRQEDEEFARYWNTNKSAEPTAHGSSSPATAVSDDLGQCVTGDTLLPILLSTINYKPSTKKYILKPIVQVKPGDYVLSLNEETQAIEPHRIKGLLDMGVKPVFKLTTASGRSIKTTANHPYLTAKGWVKVSGLKAGDEIACPVDAKHLDGRVPKEESSLSFNGYSRMAFFTDTYLGSSNYSKPFAENLEFVSLEKGKYCWGRAFNGWGFDFYEDNSRIRTDRETEDIAEIVIKSKKDTIFSDTKFNNFFIRNSREASFQNAIHFVAGVPERFYGGDEEALVGKEFHLDSFLNKDIFVFDNPYRIMNSCLDIFPSKLGVTVGEDPLNSITRFYKLQEHINRYSGSLDAGLAKTDLRVNRDSFFQRIISHYFHLQTKLYHKFKEASSILCSQAYAQPAIASDILWDRIVAIEPLGYQQVYDIEVEGTHNFIGGNAVPREDGTSFYGGIFAHNTYIGERPASSPLTTDPAIERLEDVMTSLSFSPGLKEKIKGLLIQQQEKTSQMGFLPPNAEHIARAIGYEWSLIESAESNHKIRGELKEIFENEGKVEKVAKAAVLLFKIGFARIDPKNGSTYAKNRIFALEILDSLADDLQRDLGLGPLQFVYFKEAILRQGGFGLGTETGFSDFQKAMAGEGWNVVELQDVKEFKKAGEKTIVVTSKGEVENPLVVTNMEKLENPLTLLLTIVSEIDIPASRLQPGQKNPEFINALGEIFSHPQINDLYEERGALEVEKEIAVAENATEERLRSINERIAEQRTRFNETLRTLIQKRILEDERIRASKDYDKIKEYVAGIDSDSYLWYVGSYHIQEVRIEQGRIIILFYADMSRMKGAAANEPFIRDFHQGRLESLINRINKVKGWEGNNGLELIGRQVRHNQPLFDKILASLKPDLHAHLKMSMEFNIVWSAIVRFNPEGEDGERQRQYAEIMEATNKLLVRLGKEDVDLKSTFERARLAVKELTQFIQEYGSEEMKRPRDSQALSEGMDFLAANAQKILNSNADQIPRVAQIRARHAIARYNRAKHYVRHLINFQEGGLSLFVIMFKAASNLLKILHNNVLEALNDITKKVLAGYSAQRSDYTEQRFNIGQTLEETRQEVVAVIKAYKEWAQEKQRENEERKAGGYPEVVIPELRLILSILKPSDPEKSDEEKKEQIKNSATIFLEILREARAHLGRPHRDYERLTGVEGITAQEVLNYLRGIDAAGQEEGAPPDLFVDALERVHQYNAEAQAHKIPRIGLTFHIAESIQDVSPESGIRNSVIAITQLKMDRLGHNITPAIDFAQLRALHKDGKPERISERIKQILFDLDLLRQNVPLLAVTQEGLEQELRELDFYWTYKRIEQIEERLRNIEIQLKQQVEPGEQGALNQSKNFLSQELARLRRYTARKEGEWLGLTLAKVQQKRGINDSNEVIYRYDSAEKITDLKTRAGYALDLAIKHDVVIETNPTSNLGISPYVQGYNSHLKTYLTYTYGKYFRELDSYLQDKITALAGSGQERETEALRNSLTKTRAYLQSEDALALQGQKVKITINTDDQTLLGTSINEEIYRVGDGADVTEEAILQLMKDSYKYKIGEHKRREKVISASSPLGDGKEKYPLIILKEEQFVYKERIKTRLGQIIEGYRGRGDERLIDALRIAVETVDSLERGEWLNRGYSRYQNVAWHDVTHAGNNAIAGLQAMQGVIAAMPEYSIPYETMFLLGASFLYHDVGYYKPDRVFGTMKIDHEQRSKEFVWEHGQSLGLSERDIALVSLLIAATQASIDPWYWNRLEELVKKMLDKQAILQEIDELKELLEVAESEDFAGRPLNIDINNLQDLNLLLGIILGAKIIASLDIYDTRELGVPIIVSLWQEFSVDRDTLKEYFERNGIADGILANLQQVREKRKKVVEQETDEEAASDVKKKAAVKIINDNKIINIIAEEIERTLHKDKDTALLLAKAVMEISKIVAAGTGTRQIKGTIWFLKGYADPRVNALGIWQSVPEDAREDFRINRSVIEAMAANKEKEEFSRAEIDAMLQDAKKLIPGSASSPAAQEQGEAEGRCVTADTLLPILPAVAVRQLSLRGSGTPPYRKGGYALAVQATEAISKTGLLRPFGARNDGYWTVSSAKSQTPSAREYVFKPIIEVKPGDYVLSLNEETQTIEPHRIKGLLDMGVKPVFKLTTASGRSIKTTANHPYLTNKGWVKVSGLRVGDEIGVVDRITASLVQKGICSARNGNSSWWSGKTINSLLINSLGNGLSVRSRSKAVFIWLMSFGIILRRMMPEWSTNGEWSAKSLSCVMSTRFSEVAILKTPPLAKPLGDRIVLYPRPARNERSPRWTFSSSKKRISFLQKSRVKLAGLQNPSGVVQSCLHMLRRQVRIGVLDLLCRSVGLKHVENQVYHNTRTFETGFPVTDVRVGRNIILDFHICSLVTLFYSTLINLSSLFAPKVAYAQSPIQNAILWDRIVSIEPLGYQQVYDIEVEGTHNFIGNGIFAHNTYLPSDQRTVTSGQKDQKDQKEEIASSPMDKGVEDAKNPGGIDLRALPIVTQPVGASPLGTVHDPFRDGSLLKPSLREPSLSSAGAVPVAILDTEWRQIENMTQVGLIPSNERIREYLQASCQSEDCTQRIDKVLSLFADILRLEEERVSSTEPALRDMLALLESDKSSQELQVALGKIEVAPKEPQVIEE